MPYPYGEANTTPHIHSYPGGCHIKLADGTRINLVQNHVRVRQARLNEVFDSIRATYPDVHNATRVPLLAALADELRNVAVHVDDRG